MCLIRSFNKKIRCDIISTKFTILKYTCTFSFEIRDVFIGALMYCKISLFFKSKQRPFAWKQWHLVKYIIWSGSTCDCWLAGRARAIYIDGELKFGAWVCGWRGGGYLDLNIVCIHHPRRNKGGRRGLRGGRKRRKPFFEALIWTKMLKKRCFFHSETVKFC